MLSCHTLGVPPFAHLQLQLRQARALSNITLFKSPVKTVYYFGCYALKGLYSGAKWVASHPVTLLVILPALLAYAGTKWTGYGHSFMTELEVSTVWHLGVRLPQTQSRGNPGHTTRVCWETSQAAEPRCGLGVALYDVHATEGNFFMPCSFRGWTVFRLRLWREGVMAPSTRLYE